MNCKNRIKIYILKSFSIVKILEQMFLKSHIKKSNSEKSLNSIYKNEWKNKIKFQLYVQFLQIFIISFSFLPVKPEIKVTSEIVGAPVESQVVLECIVQVYPKPLNGWYKNTGT